MRNTERIVNQKLPTRCTLTSVVVSLACFSTASQKKQNSQELFAYRQAGNPQQETSRGGGGGRSCNLLIQLFFFCLTTHQSNRQDENKMLIRCSWLSPVHGIPDTHEPGAQNLTDPELGRRLSFLKNSEYFGQVGKIADGISRLQVKAEDLSGRRLREWL